MAKHVVSLTVTGDNTGAKKALKDTGEEAQGLKSRLSSVFSAGRKALGGDLTGALDDVKSSASGIPIAGAAIAGGLAIGGTAVLGFATKSLSAAEDVDKAANKLSRISGLSVQDASRWNFAASQVGISSDTLVKSLGKFEKGAITNGKALGSMGISMTDANGKARSMKDVLDDVATKFKGMPDGPQKTALAMQLFGKSGADMIPLLNKGADGLDALAKKSDQFGLTVGQGSVDAMKKNVAAQRDMSAAFKGIETQLGNALLPVLASVSGWIAGHLPGAIAVAKKVFGELGDVISTISTGIGVTIDWVGAHFGGVFQGIGQAIQGVIQFFQGLYNFVDDLFHGRWGQLWGDVKQVFTGVWNDIKGVFHAAVSEVTGVFTTIGPTILGFLHDGFFGVLHFMESLPGKMVDAAEAIGSAIWRGIINGIKSAVSFIGDLAKSLYNHIAGFINKEFIDPVANFSISLPLIGKISPFGLAKHLELPTLAEGGIAKARPGGTLAIIGEGKYDEAVVPLDGKHFGGGTTHSHTYNITVNAPSGNAQEIAQATVNALKAARRLGMTGLAA